MIRISAVLLFVITLTVENAYAYIDFGTGSYVLQILAASAIGCIFVIKNYFRRIKQFFTRKPLIEKSVAENTEGQ